MESLAYGHNPIDVGLAEPCNKSLVSMCECWFIFLHILQFYFHDQSLIYILVDLSQDSVATIDATTSRTSSKTNNFFFFFQLVSEQVTLSNPVQSVDALTICL